MALRKKKEKRENAVTFLLNDSELRALDKYVARYGIRNRSAFLRKTIMQTILTRFDKDSPTLF